MALATLQETLANIDFYSNLSRRGNSITATMQILMSNETTIVSIS